MITIDPPQPPGTSRRDAVRKRELSRFLARAIQSVGLDGSVSVLLTGDDRIRQLNREFRRKDKATDVLSFPATDFGALATEGRQRLAGDLAVSLETAARQAAVFGHALELEVKILLLHGLLHLAGFDHETDSGQMARRESRLRKEFALPSGLIQRSNGGGPQPAKTIVKSAKASPKRRSRTP
jgi:probable rRNA maturation factor